MYLKITVYIFINMLIFNKIFLNKFPDNNFKNDQFLFACNFNYFNEYYLNDSSYKELIKYKYYILKNFLFSSSIKEESKDKLLTTFSTIQKYILSLYRLKHKITLKYRKFKGDQVDLNFNLLSEHTKNTIVLYDTNNKYIFNIFEIIKIMCTALSYDDNFFIEPHIIKNPWNNQKFTLSQLSYIYFYIKQTNIHMPILIERFYASNFNIIKFQNENQFIVKQYIINNCHKLPVKKKLKYIGNLLNFYNKTSIKDNQIRVSSLYTDEYIVKIFERFIKIYLQSKYSYESDIRNQNKILLKKKLRTFKLIHSKFGRKITFLNIKKLYCISRLKYEDDELFFSCSTIPTPEMIHVSKKSFLTQYNFNIDNQYTLFPTFLDFKKNAYIHHTSDNNNIENLSLFVKNYKFTPHQLNIIKNKYTDYLNSIEYNYDSILYDKFSTECDINDSSHEPDRIYDLFTLMDSITIINRDRLDNNTPVLDSDNETDNIIDISNNEINNENNQDTSEEEEFPNEDLYNSYTDDDSISNTSINSSDED
jgi:hypothetical protein